MAMQSSHAPSVGTVRPNLHIACSSLDTTEFTRTELLGIAASSLVRPLIDKILMSIQELTIPVLVERDKAGEVVAIDHTILNPGYEPLLAVMTEDMPIGCTKYKRIRDDSIDVLRIRDAIDDMNRSLLLTFLTFGSVYFRLVAQFDIVECRFTIHPEFTDCRHARSTSGGMTSLKVAMERIIASTTSSLTQFTQPSAVPLTAWICVYDNQTPAELSTRYCSHVERAGHIVVAINARMYMSEIGCARIMLAGDTYIKDVHEVTMDPRSEVHLFGAMGAADRTEERDSIRLVKTDGPTASGTVGSLLRSEIGGVTRRLPRNTDITLQAVHTPLDDAQVTYDLETRALVNIFFPSSATLIPRTALKDKHASVSKDSSSSVEQGNIVNFISMLNKFLYKYETIVQRVIADEYPFPDKAPMQLIYTPEMYMVSMLNVTDRVRMTGGNVGIKSELDIFRVQQFAQSQRDVAQIQSEQKKEKESRKRAKKDSAADD